MNTSIESNPVSPKPLRVQFVTTSLPVGGAETLLLNLLQHMDKEKVSPEIICLKEAGDIGEEISQQFPVHAGWLKSKWDATVLFRLAKHFRKRNADAVITIGAGDKMFWGRLAARLAGVPVVCSALHSTGWPDGIGWLNRMLTPLTDGFIAVAQQHAEHLAEFERLPPSRVFLIPNGVDTDRFRPNHTKRKWLRECLDLPADSKIVGIVAALREEKNHLQFIDAARDVLRSHPQTHFLIVGEGPEREKITAHIQNLGVEKHFHLLGSRSDIENILAGIDIFCLTSRNEANPVSILEALSCGIPVVAPDVGSISETVQNQQTGLLTQPVSAISTSKAIQQLLESPRFATVMGLAGRQLVRDQWSLNEMVTGYQALIQNLYDTKTAKPGVAATQSKAFNSPPETVETRAEIKVSQEPLAEAASPIVTFNLPMETSDGVSV